jgi:FAD/FMN-containing dehydrogenase
MGSRRIWPKPVGGLPRAVVHCRIPEDVHLVVRAARDCNFPLSVRGEHRDWAGRALCEGTVVDLSGMNAVIADAEISGGARAKDVSHVSDPLGLAAMTGAVGMVVWPVSPRVAAMAR